MFCVPYPISTVLYPIAYILYPMLYVLWPDCILHETLSYSLIISRMIVGILSDVQSLQITVGGTYGQVQERLREPGFNSDQNLKEPPRSQKGTTREPNFAGKVSSHCKPLWAAHSQMHKCSKRGCKNLGLTRPEAPKRYWDTHGNGHGHEFSCSWSWSRPIEKVAGNWVILFPK